MVKAKLWTVKFGSIEHIVVNAPNVESAIKKALANTKTNPECNINEIDEVSFIASED